MYLEIIFPPLHHKMSVFAAIIFQPFGFMCQESLLLAKALPVSSPPDPVLFHVLLFSGCFFFTLCPASLSLVLGRKHLLILREKQITVISDHVLASLCNLMTSLPFTVRNLEIRSGLKNHHLYSFLVTPKPTSHWLCP